MEKYYCDICGKECDDTTKFIVPIIVDSEVKGGIGDVVEFSIFFDVPVKLKH